MQEAATARKDINDDEEIKDDGCDRMVVEDDNQSKVIQMVCTCVDHIIGHRCWCL